jgi:hypothetical protein
VRIAACLLALAPFATASCLATGEDDAEGDGAFSISVSAADTALVLDLVNYPRVDLAMLDDDAGLDARAAKAIIAHRNGLDTSAMTWDDDWYETLAELDAISYVGDSALTKLIAFAHAHPVPPSVTIEGVTFKGWQAEATVWGLNNQATFEELDRGLDARAATSLIDNRPYASLDAVGAAPYVGSAVLRGLRAHSPLWWGAMDTTPQPCAVAVSARADQTVSDLSLLIETATTLDWPWATMSASALPDCVDAGVTSPQVDAVSAALTGYARSAWGSGIQPLSSGLVRGGEHFVNLVITARDVIDERVADERWAPANSAEQALLDALPAMVDTLTAGPVANPADYVELPLWTDGEECSEYGSILIQLSTHRGWMIHQFPRC